MHKEDVMATELLWKRAVRRGIESQRREPRECNFEQACDLSAFVIGRMHEYLSGSSRLSQAELNRRVSLHLGELDRMERKLAATWRQVTVTVRE